MKKYECRLLWSILLIILAFILICGGIYIIGHNKRNSPTISKNQTQTEQPVSLFQNPNATTSLNISTQKQKEGCALIPYTGTTSLEKLPYYTYNGEDFRGGMICVFIINPNLPVFTFHFDGEADNTLGNIEITEGTSTKIIQTIDSGGIDPNSIAPEGPQDILQTADVNFDGYDDLAILNQCGATASCDYYWYLYDPATNQFIENSFLEDLWGFFQLDNTNKEITVTNNGNFQNLETDTYQYENGRYVLIKKEATSSKTTLWDK